MNTKNPTSVLTPYLEQHLHHFTKPNKAIYWIDLILTSIFAWTGFITFFISDSNTILFWIGYGMAVLLFYRKVSFIHEIVHLRKGSIPGFETVWNLVCGYFLFVPSVLYHTVHNEHHNVQKYGTQSDPEYIPISGERRKILFFIVTQLFGPILIMFRFLVLSPISWGFPSLRRIIQKRASSLSINPMYIRNMKPREQRKLLFQEIHIFILWSLILFFVLAQNSVFKLLICYYGTVALILFINSLRSLTSHKYENKTLKKLSRDEQFADSIDIPGNWFTELWAPVGLRFHALHHYVPGVPYHNLYKLHKTLLRDLKEDSPYFESTKPGLRKTLQELWNKT